MVSRFVLSTLGLVLFAPALIGLVILLLWGIERTLFYFPTLGWCLIYVMAVQIAILSVQLISYIFKKDTE